MISPIQAQSDRAGVSLNIASRIVDDAWHELQRSPSVQQNMGIALTRLPDVSLEETERRSEVGKSLLRRLDTIDLGAIPHDLALTLRLVRFHARNWAQEADWYWNVVDPRGIGHFGLFLPTAYCGGYLLNSINQQLASFSFREAGDTDRYLALVADYARLLDQFTARTTGQAQRGILMPKVQVLQARSLLTAFKSNALAEIGVAPQRLTAVSRKSFAHDLDRRIATCVEPAFDRALEGLSVSYLDRAPETVGIEQYPHGAEIYADLVKLNTTLDLTPEQVHSRGLERMAEIEISMRGIRGELGFEADPEAFLAKLNSDPRWRANTVEGVAAVFHRYINRLEPHLDKYFAALPKASYDVAPLPDALQKSMTFGYYDLPRNDRSGGLYMFNPANLTKQALFNIGALTYHELMPGHHLHLAGQRESPILHPFRAHSFVTAFVEGWAEYAATLAGEIGMYDAPEERYGRLMMDAFLTSRLVVDTGMNVLGWSLERAREYMRMYGKMAEAEILTESIRYSCDIPAQSLAYKLGDTRILASREKMRLALGARFDVRQFHAAVLGVGALPIPDLEWHVEHEAHRIIAGDEMYAPPDQGIT